ncbi:MAG: hypothetical protein JSW08_01750 [archaeon]|nr:MAG: hypothetical protein JSW08_01750 [archaeon]
MIPKVMFRYSKVYDAVFQTLSSDKFKDVNDKIFDAREKFAKKKIQILKKWWANKEKNVLNKISKITNVKWEQKEIKIYLLPDAYRLFWLGGFSEPLTVFLRYKKKNGEEKEKSLMLIKNTIIHELVHQNLSPKKGYTSYVNSLKKKYKCNRICAAHIVVHAIISKIYSKEELKFELERKIRNKSYKKAWEIVRKYGEDKIIKDFLKIH